jgi:hypothetical protein
VKCPCCGGDPLPERAEGILLNRSLSLSSDIVMYGDRLRALTKKEECLRSDLERRLQEALDERRSLDEERLALRLERGRRP